MADVVKHVKEAIAEGRIRDADSDGEYRAAWITFRRRDGSMDYTTIAADHRNGFWAADGTTYQDEPGRTDVSDPIFDARRVLAECPILFRSPEDGALVEGKIDLLAQEEGG